MSVSQYIQGLALGSATFRGNESLVMNFTEGNSCCVDIAGALKLLWNPCPPAQPLHLHSWTEWAGTAAAESDNNYKGGKCGDPKWDQHNGMEWSHQDGGNLLHVHKTINAQILCPGRHHKITTPNTELAHKTQKKKIGHSHNTRKSLIQFNNQS